MNSPRTSSLPSSDAHFSCIIPHITTSNLVTPSIRAAATDLIAPFTTPLHRHHLEPEPIHRDIDHPRLRHLRIEYTREVCIPRTLAAREHCALDGLVAHSTSAVIPVLGQLRDELYDCSGLGSHRDRPSGAVPPRAQPENRPRPEIDGRRSTVDIHGNEVSDQRGGDAVAMLARRLHLDHCRPIYH